MKILLDTNFILTCAKQKIDFSSFANDIVDEEINWVVPQDVINELGVLKDMAGMKVQDRDAAKLGFEMMQNLDVEIVQLSGKNPNVDMKIVNYLLENKDVVLATMDKDLKSRIDNKILTIRGKNNVKLV